MHSWKQRNGQLEKQLELQRQSKQKQEDQQRKMREEIIRQENARKVITEKLSLIISHMHALFRPKNRERRWKKMLNC